MCFTLSWQWINCDCIACYGLVSHLIDFFLPCLKYRDLREHLRRLQQQSDSRRRAAVMEMMRQRAAEVANNGVWFCSCALNWLGYPEIGFSWGQPDAHCCLNIAHNDTLQNSFLAIIHLERVSVCLPLKWRWGASLHVITGASPPKFCRMRVITAEILTHLGGGGGCSCSPSLIHFLMVMGRQYLRWITSAASCPFLSIFLGLGRDVGSRLEFPLMLRPPLFFSFFFFLFFL